MQKYLPQIDSLRALAIITVLINHIDKDFLPNGYLGVDVFFLISGYVITNSIASKNFTNFFDFIKSFYKKRVRRLLPASLIYIFFISILTLLFVPRPTDSLITGAFSLVGLSNIFLYFNSTDYFADSTLLNPFTQTWSLSLEEQFYFVFPFLAWFSNFAKGKKNGDKNMFFWLITISSFSLILFIFFQFYRPMAGYFLLPARFWELSAGSILFLIQKRYKKNIENLSGSEKVNKNIISYISLVFLFFILFSRFDQFVFTSISVIISTSVFIYNFEEYNPMFIFLTSRPILYLGLISYSLYLWHWGIISLGRWTFGIYKTTIPIYFFMIFAVSIISYEFIEKKFRYSIFNFSIIKLLISINILITFILTIVIKTPIPETVRKFGIGISGWKFKPTDLGDPDNINKWCYEKASLPIETFYSCPTFKISGGETDSIIYALGDSHMTNHIPSIINSLSESRKKPKELIQVKGSPFKSDEENKYWFSILDFMKNNLRNKDIVLFATQITDLKENKSISSKNSLFKINELKNELKKLSKIVEENNSKLILINDLPRPCLKIYPHEIDNRINYNIEVLKNGKLDACKYDMNDSKEFLKPMTTIFEDIKLLSNTNFLIDFHDVLCPEQECTAEINNDALYFDLSPHFRENHPYILSKKWKELFMKNNIFY